MLPSIKIIIGRLEVYRELQDATASYTIYNYLLLSIINLTLFFKFLLNH